MIFFFDAWSGEDGFKFNLFEKYLDGVMDFNRKGLPA